MKKTIIVLASLFIVGCAQVTQEDIKNADYGVYPDQYEKIAKSYYEEVAKDPDSIKYREITQPKKSWVNDFGTHKFGYMTCVTRNGKNSYGAYVGYKTDGILIKNGIIIHVVNDVDEMNRVWKSSFCQ